MKQLLPLLIIALCSLGRIVAQTTNYEGEQVLVYRNNGDITLFFTDELDSITLSQYDTDSVWYENPVSQVFHTTDTTLVLPINEIDSVALGSRNIVKFHHNVRQITTDSTWIIRYVDHTLYYKIETPENILPKVGEKLYYGKADSLFPVGLAAKVNSVELENNEFVVSVSNVDINDIFEQLFYAGQITREPQTRGFDLNNTWELKGNIPLGENGEMYLKGDMKMTGKVVSNPKIGYYHCDAHLDLAFLSGIRVKIEGEKRFEHRLLSIPLGPFGMVLFPQLTINGVVSLSGEVDLHQEFERTSGTHLIWTKRKDQDDEFVVTHDGTHNGDNAMLEVLCNGEIFSGISPVIDFHILALPSYGRLTVEIGGCMEGELSVGVLRDLSQYHSDLYAKGSGYSSLRIGAKCGICTLEYLYWGKEREQTLIEEERKLFRRPIHFFPQFEATTATSYPSEQQREVSVATKIIEDVNSELEMGFEVVDTEEHVIDSAFVGILTNEPGKTQGFQNDFQLPNTIVPVEKELEVRPIFHYAGYTVRAQKANVSENILMQPIICTQSNGVVTCLSGIPYTGNAHDDSTLCIAGPYLPIPITDTIFNQPQPPMLCVFVEDEVIGEWNGPELETNITYLFNDDNSGRMSCGDETVTFTWEKNYPQSGHITLSLADGRTKLLKITRINGEKLTYFLPDSNTSFTLDKVP